MRPIFETVHGSRLYGTDGPQSDHDFKGVHIPAWTDIVSPVIPDTVNFSTGNDLSKNTADDIDREFCALHKYFFMLVRGDMNAYEMLFAPNLSPSLEWDHIISVRESLLSRQCKGFVGYVQRQASVYGAKGNRLNEIKDAIKLFDGFPSGKLYLTKNIEQILVDFSVGKQHTFTEMLTNGEKEMFHFSCCDRKFPMTITKDEAMKIMGRVEADYGNRARAAATNTGVDWKSVSHAIRIGEQAVELLSTGNITFPRPNAAYLKEIKAGVHPYMGISPKMDVLLSEVERLSAMSSLPVEPDTDLMKAIVQDFYLKEVLTSHT